MKVFKKTVVAFLFSATLVSSLFGGAVIADATDYSFGDRSTWATVRSGSSGGFVGSVQADMWASGYSSTVGTVDGSFGSRTEQAVRSYQTKYGLTSDGVVGRQTWAKLEAFTTNVNLWHRLYSNSGSSTYEVLYTNNATGDGTAFVNYYLRYKSNKNTVKLGTVYEYGEPF